MKTICLIDKGANEIPRIDIHWARSLTYSYKGVFVEYNIIYI